MIQHFGSWVRRFARSAITTSLFVTSFGVTAQAGGLHPALRSLIAEGPPDRTSRVWILFEDHAFPSPDSLKAALAAAQDEIGEAALARRARPAPRGPILPIFPSLESIGMRWPATARSAARAGG